MKGRAGSWLLMIIAFPLLLGAADQKVDQRAGKPNAEHPVIKEDDARDASSKVPKSRAQLPQECDEKSGQPLEGFCKRYYDSGALKGEGTYKRGKPDGLVKTYHENSNLFQASLFKDGVEEGVRKEYNSNGVLEHEWVMQGGQLNGHSKEYYANGVVKSELPYKGNKLEGVRREYSESGTLIGEVPYKNGVQEGLAKTYYPSGKLQSEIAMKNGKMNGPAEWYYENGNVKGKIAYLDNVQDGPGKQYYENGQVQTEVTYVHGKQEGIAKVYSENGTLEREGTYHNGEAIREVAHEGQGRPTTVSKIEQGVPIVPAQDKATAAKQKTEIDLLISFQSQTDELRKRGQYEKALRLANKFIEDTQQKVGARHWLIAEMLAVAGDLHRELKQYGEAESLYREALAIDEAILGQYQVFTVEKLLRLAWVRSDQGYYVSAESLFKQAIADIEAQYSSEHSNLLGPLMNLINFYRDRGRSDEANVLQLRKLEIEDALTQHVSKSTHNVVDADTLIWRATMVHMYRFEYPEAEQLLRQALSLKEQTLGPNHPGLAKVLADLANLRWIQQDFTEAEALYKRALAIKEATLPKDDPELAHWFSKVALAYTSQRRYAEAEPFYERAVATIEKAQADNTREALSIFTDYAECLKKLGKSDQAGSLETRIKQHAAEPSKSAVPASASAGSTDTVPHHPLFADDWPTRSTALKDTQHLDSATKKALLPTLIQATKSKSDAVRARAADALGTVGPEAEEALPVLIEMLKDPNYQVRYNALHSLDHFEVPSSLVLRLMASRDEDEHISEWAAGRFHKLDLPVRVASIPTLIEMLHDIQTDRCLWAVGALEELGPAAQEAIPAMRAAIRTKVPQPEMGWAVFHELPVETERSQHTRDHIDFFRSSAAQVLRKIGPAGIAALVAVLQDKDWSTRALAVTELGKLDQPTPEIAAAVAHLISRSSEEVGVRRMALATLERFGAMAQAATPELIRLLLDKDVGFEVACVLPALDPTAQEAVPVLLQALQSEKFSKWRAALALAAVRPMRPEAIPFLIDLLRARDAADSIPIATALGRFGPEAQSAVPALIEALSRKYTSMSQSKVREEKEREAEIAIVSALECIGTPDALEAVRENRRRPK